MSTSVLDPVVSAALSIVVKATVLMGIAVVVQLVVRRRASAATRHLLWMLAIVSVLLLPAASLVLPGWAVEVRSAPEPATRAPFATREAPGVDLSSPTREEVIVEYPRAAAAAARGSWSATIAGVYVAGAIGFLVHLIAQLWRGRRFARHASVVRDVEWMHLFTECANRIGIRRPVRLLRSREHNVPAALGTRRPAIVIPAIADSWADDRRRAVVLHELAHVARHDCLTATVAAAACALYWFHPAAWWIARRLRIERELACDDRVIAAGTEGRAYAGHLLEIAYSLGGHRAPALAVCMARRRQIEGRLLAAIDPARDRSVPALRVRVASAAIAAALMFPLAVVRPAAVAAQTEVPPPPLDWAKVRAAMPEAVSAVAAFKRIVQAALPGTWEIRPATEGTVHLRLVEINSSTGTNIRVDQLEGLTPSQLTGAGGPVQFRLRRDAGTFTFEGVVRSGVGAGTFTFAADPNFAGELVKRGYSQPTASEQYQMARHDIGYAFVDELSKQGYSKTTTSELVRAGQHGVGTTYLREMGALGYRLGSLEALVTLRDHGVSPTYVRELADLGYKGLSADELRNARDHGVSPEYVRAMRDAGYGSLKIDALINARDHGVSAEFVRELGEAGHRKVPLDELIRVRDHGVSPSYVRDMRQLGHALPLNELVRARDHGVSVEFVRELAALGYTNQSMESLIQLRDHGVTPQYAQELRTLGYERLAPADLIALRDHGLTSDRIRAANARAGTRLPVERLIGR